MDRFKIKTEVCFKQNALDLLKQFKNETVVVITDKFMVSSGAVNKITSRLTDCQVTVFDGVTPDPTTELIASGLKVVLENKATVVVALGGGSAIDAAKCMVLMAENNGLGKVVLVAVPTTSGTGSEVTKFAVVTDTAEHRKYPLVDEGLLPDYAILDPELVATAPPSVTADTGLDVITHALEALVSINHNDASDALAEKALMLAFRYLPVAFQHGDDITAREKMHSASCLAGMAFNEVSLGINHGIAHALGAKFHIPHGRANALLLPHVVEYNANLDACFGNEPTEAALCFADMAAKLGLPHDNVRIGVQSLVNEIKYLMRSTGRPETLWECRVTREQFEAEKADIIKSALADGCTPTNPRKVTAEDVEMLLSKITP